MTFIGLKILALLNDATKGGFFFLRDNQTKGNDMSKKLKIQFWKAEKALAMQILEQEGLPNRKEEGDVRIWDYSALFKEAIVLGRIDGHISHDIFDSNAERDECLQKAVNAITDELFTGGGELKVGEMCEVSNDGEKWNHRKLLAILPKDYYSRFIAGDDYGNWYSWNHARPIANRTEPTIEECGQLITYTWEEK